MSEIPWATGGPESRHWPEALNLWFAVLLVLAMFLVYGLVWVLERRVFGLATPEAAMQALTVAMPNYVAVGLPLSSSVFGPGAGLAVSVAIAAGSVSVAPLTLALLDPGAADGLAGEMAAFWGALRRSAPRPVFAAPLFGLAWTLLGLPLPHLAHVTLGTIGTVAGGTSLFVTGLVLSAHPLAVGTNALAGTVIKNIVQPLLGAALVWLLPVPHPYDQYALLLLAIPAGFSGILFGLDRGTRVPVVGQTLVASCLASMVTLAVAIALVGSPR